jgi:uncharacterized Fe-S center protein
MAREDLQELYQQLLKSEFRFMRSGSQHIENIYNEVKINFNNLCDDSYLCTENCSSGHNQPEWQHTIRKALDRLKKISSSVAKDKKHKHWIIR